jgi:hypothetical protein
MPTDGTPESNRAVIDWTRDSATPASMDKNGDDKPQLSISTLEGALWVAPGDWVLQGVKGEFYPCKPDIFASLYDEAPPIEPAGAELGGAAGAQGEMPLDQAAGHVGSNVLAASAAAAYAAGGEWPTVRFTGVPNPADAMPIFAKAAEFLRQWPDGSAEAVTIHVRMKGFPDTPVPGPRELAAWKVFAFTLITLDQVDADEAAAKAAAEPAPPAPVFPGERSYQPEPGTFDPTGYSLRR